ncbi:MAG: entericidin A/B family lipoprotein [Oceanicaulis sp.]
MTPIIRIAAAGLLAASMLALSACNTIQGIGRDVTRTGEVLEDITTDASDVIDTAPQVQAAP